jgi:hypothetical protein
VTFRLTLRRTPKPHSLCVLPRSTRVASPSSSCFPLAFSSNSLPLNSLVDLHLLNPIGPILYERQGGGGYPFSSARLATHRGHRTQVLSFHAVAHSFALCKKSTPLFSSVFALFAPKHPGWGYPPTFKLQDVQAVPPSHCGAKPLVQQFAKARDFFPIRGNNSAPPGV